MPRHPRPTKIVEFSTPTFREHEWPGVTRHAVKMHHVDPAIGQWTATQAQDTQTMASPLEYDTLLFIGGHLHGQHRMIHRGCKKAMIPNIKSHGFFDPMKSGNQATHMTVAYECYVRCTIPLADKTRIDVMALDRLAEDSIVDYVQNFTAPAPPGSMSTEEAIARARGGGTPEHIFYELSEAIVQARLSLRSSGLTMCYPSIIDDAFKPLVALQAKLYAEIQ